MIAILNEVTIFSLFQFNVFIPTEINANDNNITIDYLSRPYIVVNTCNMYLQYALLISSTFICEHKVHIQNSERHVFNEINGCLSFI